jgi:phosphate transport system permease protein
MKDILLKRRVKGRIYIALCYGALAVALVPLLSILLVTTSKALPVIDSQFVTQLPAPVGSPGGGIANAIQGTAIVVGVASLIGIPVGVLSGIYLSEYGGKLADLVRFLNEVLTGFPSIVVGLFVWGTIVMTLHHFAAIAGSIALSILMIPVVSRTTEESLKLVPKDLREAALALGIPKWRTTLSIVLSSGRNGVITGSILAVSRVAGETAPMLLTSLSSSFWFSSLDQPVATLPITIYYYAISPFVDLQNKAWGAAFLLMAFLLATSVSVRVISGRRVTA